MKHARKLFPDVVISIKASDLFKHAPWVILGGGPGTLAPNAST